MPPPDAPLPDMRFGSDLIVGVLQESHIEHVALNPGATIRGLHEALVYFAEHGGPDSILCTHEEIAVGLAHGYAKASGQVMAVALHNVVGLQHAAMAIFNAWCDRVPLVVLGGTGPMRQAERRPWIDWIHTAYLQGGLVRDFVKWDVQVFGAESIVDTMRTAIRTATTSPPGPVYVCFDVEDQEAQVGPPDFPSEPPGASSEVGVRRSDVDLVLAALETARRPVILADHFNRPGTARLADDLAAFAERWAAAVVDLGGRFNMPTAHDLALSEARDEVLAEADLVLALDVRDLQAALRSAHGVGQRGARNALVPEDATIISVTDETVPLSSWVPAHFGPQRFDHQIPVPGAVLVEQLLSAHPSPTESESRAGRREQLRRLHQDLTERWQSEAQQAWDERPISTARLCTELGQAMQGEGWILANSSFVHWPKRLWPFDGTRITHIGRSGGEGLGYGLSASLGAALAAKEKGHFAVDIQGDGDLMFVPGALWTAAASKLPLLVVVHNNGSYHQDARHQSEVSDERQRGRASVHSGIDITEPQIDFATLARSMGVWAEGPVVDPDALGDVFTRAVRHMKETGGPALVDVVSAPR